MRGRRAKGKVVKVVEAVSLRILQVACCGGSYNNVSRRGFINCTTFILRSSSECIIILHLPTVCILYIDNIIILYDIKIRYAFYIITVLGLLFPLVVKQKEENRVTLQRIE